MQKIVITLIDDLDPTGETEADETVTFALDGITYEIDLTHENAHVLRARLKEFTQAGRVVKSASMRPSQPTTEPAGRGATTNRHQGGVDPQAARTWAREQNLLVPTRGRLPKEIKDAYSSFEKFGDRSLLDKLLKEQGGRLDGPIPYQDEEDPGAPTVTPAMTAAKRSRHRAGR
ncbi:Lsr2 family protein [Streptomyces sp. AD2-2]|nr:Lsr2 family protein [Streptomyces sp. AD2-2]